MDSLQSSAADQDSIFDYKVPADTGAFGTYRILLNTAIGSGTLMIPYCFTCGVGISLIISFIFALLAYFSLMLLIDSSQYCHKYDYHGLFSHCFGKGKLWILNIIIFLVQYGSVMIYCHWLGRLMNHIFQFSNVILGSNAFWICSLTSFFVFPLTIFREISALQNFTFLTLIFLFILIAHAFYYFIHDLKRDGFDPNNQFSVFNFKRYDVIITALSVNALAFHCHLNMFSSLEHLKHCTIKRAHLLCALVPVGCFVLYNIFGLFSYLNLFDRLKSGSSLEYYSPQTTFTKIATGGVLVVLIISSPLMNWSCRLSVNDLLYKDKPMTNLRWVTIGGLICLTAAFLASSSEKIRLFFNVFGGLFMPIIEFMLPALFFFKTQNGMGSIGHKFIAIILIAFSIIAMILCTYQAIKDIIND